jgi:hypothetical protein
VEEIIISSTVAIHRTPKPGSFKLSPTSLTIDWNLSYPNPIHFLRQTSKADQYNVQSGLKRKLPTLRTKEDEELLDDKERIPKMPKVEP